LLVVLKVCIVWHASYAYVTLPSDGHSLIVCLVAVLAASVGVRHVSPIIVWAVVGWAIGLKMRLIV
jgi:hypothetical protein